MRRYRMVVLGLGPRGVVHADAALALPERYELAGVCDVQPARLEDYARRRGLDRKILFSDAETMLAATRPDLFCFVTQPSASRLEFLELGLRHGIRAFAFEKPIATSLREAARIRDLCAAQNLKAVVSHQQKYLTSLQAVRAAVVSGEIGALQRVHASCQAWLAQLGTHYVDYAHWVNGGVPADWVVGHVHGRGLLENDHPSPDYVMGQIGFRNGVRAVVEFGTLSPAHQPEEQFWLDNRLTVYGENGYAWGETDGRWGLCSSRTGGKLVVTQEADWNTQQSTTLQPQYFAEFADWLDGTIAGHSCSLATAYHGYEIMEALCLSALHRTRIDLPLDLSGGGDDLFARLRRELPDCPEEIPAFARRH